MKIRYNDFRDFVWGDSQLSKAFIKGIFGRYGERVKTLPKEVLLRELEDMKQAYIKAIDSISKDIKENYKIYDGKYLVRVNFGYNAIVTDCIYYAIISGSRVDFYTDGTYTKWIPQSLNYDDINIIENPTLEDIAEADKNGELARLAYKIS